MALRLRRGTDTERQTVVFEEGELVFVTDTQQLYAGDGSTLGGILVSNIGSPEELTQNLSLNGFNISGSGTISATAFVGDGSGLTNLPISGGVVLGSNYRINIVGDDSTVLVNSATNTITGIFDGDGSNITDISLDQLDDVAVVAPSEGEVLTYVGGTWINSTSSGVTEGSSYRINIVGNDSSLLVDSDTNTFTGDLRGSVFSDNSSLIVDGVNGKVVADLETNTITSVSNNIVLSADETAMTLEFVYESASDSSASTDDRGKIYFSRNDINGKVIEAIMGGGRTGIYFITDDESGTYPQSNTLILTNSGRLGLGSYTPATKFEIKDGSLRFNESRAIASISSPVQWEITINNLNNNITYYDGIEWREIISLSTNSLAADFPGAIILSPTDQTTINDFGSDSADVTGAVTYNSTEDRFQFFQAGSWISLANQSLEETSDVKFASVTADSFISTGAGTPTLESATNLDLQAGNAVRVIGAPFRLANLTTTERNALTAANGDMIYNTTANKIQAYQNGSWINLDDGTAA